MTPLETTCARYAAACAGSPQTCAPFVPEVPWANFAQNSHYRPYSEPNTPWVYVEAGGRVFPDMWRVCPGFNNRMTAALCPPSPFDGDVGFHLYLQWPVGEWRPAAECGSAFLEHYIFEYDLLAGRSVKFSYSACVDSGSVELIPLIWLNHSDGDYEFLYGPRQTVGVQWGKFDAHFQLPTSAGRPVSSSRYVALGFTTPYNTAPGLHLGKIDLVR